MAAQQPVQQRAQSSPVSHPVDLEQHGDSQGKDSYLFSNPTFESYLDPVSDDELQLVEGCSTPRSAIKQQVSQTGARADSIPGGLEYCSLSSHTRPGADTANAGRVGALQSCLRLRIQEGSTTRVASRVCCADLRIPVACEGAALHPEPAVSRQLSFACCSAKARSVEAAHAGHMAAPGRYPSPHPLGLDLVLHAYHTSQMTQPQAHAVSVQSITSQQVLEGLLHLQAAAMLEASQGNADIGPSAVSPVVPSAGKLPQHPPVPALSAAAQQASAESCGFRAHPQPSGESAMNPPFAHQSTAGIRPPFVPLAQPAAQQTLPLPANPPAVAHPVDSSTAGSPQAFPPGTVLSDTSMHRSLAAVSPAMRLQRSPAREGTSSPGLSQSSPCPGAPVSLPPTFLRSPARDASSSVQTRALPHADLAGRDGPAWQSTPDLAAREQSRAQTLQGAQASGEVSSTTPVPKGEGVMQQSPQLSLLGVGTTPAAQTIQGMCSLGTSMPPQLSPAPPPIMPGPSDALLGGHQQYDSPGTAASPAMVGSLGIGSTPAVHTIKALEAIGRKPAPPQSTPWQVDQQPSLVGDIAPLMRQDACMRRNVKFLQW